MFISIKRHIIVTYFQTNSNKIKNCKFVICGVYFQEESMLSILNYSWLVSTDIVTLYCLWPNKKDSSIKLGT